ncbi:MULTISPECIES: MFS transporter [unclassified Dietzia]|uniref:MFS transporter n=2 Tax=unclassified Dietzia TaxID=2617939 RepID=UPI000D2093CA|nr:MULTISPECIES: MFS transporter [unclassified Dietzia]AVZ40920.1 MFS transporter [Dietzia sp. JS16-p6b]QGW26561.1 putative transporter [Dietzia sp. DQ12-45-1b]
MAPRQWAILGVGTLAASSASVFVAGVAFLLPFLHTEVGLSLPAAGALVALPSVGTALTLVAWGWLVDRTGERLVLVSGSVLTTAALAGALITPSLALLSACFLLAGAASASAASASGRLVVGWFPARRRGMAMGVRQMSQPLGAAIAAMSMPALAASHGLRAALAVPLVMAGASAVAALVVVIDPPRPDRDDPASTTLATSPYRASRYLHRIHGVSVLLVLPQALMQSFMLAWLVLGHGWSPASAGAVVTAAQLLAAAGRIAVGVISDRVGSRLTPLRAVAVSVSAGLLALAVAEVFGAPGAVAVALAVIAAVLVVADNGLAFTAVAEHAGPHWSGRALGVQNTAQFLAISAVTPVFAAGIDRWGYGPVFAGAAVVAALAVPVVPRLDRAR